MPENPKDKKDGTWEEDQKEHEYYYDDAHGYEEFDPEEEDDAEDGRRGDAECEADPEPGPGVES